MKKTRGGKKKVSSRTASHKKSSKSISSFFKKYFPVFLLVGVFLLVAIFLNITNSTGNVITGNVVKCGQGDYTLFPIDCGDAYCAKTQIDCSDPTALRKHLQEIGGSTLAPITTGRWSDTWAFLKEDGFLTKLFLYIFGVPIQSVDIGEVSAGIITIAVWLLLFITFSDIIASFSSFSKLVAWGIGFLITIIAANLGWLVNILAWIIQAFAFLGSLAVVVGLLAAFFGFVGLNIGIGKFAEWALRRRAILSAHQASAGGKKVAGAIEGMGEIEKALERLGVKK